MQSFGNVLAAKHFHKYDTFLVPLAMHILYNTFLAILTRALAVYTMLIQKQMPVTRYFMAIGKLQRGIRIHLLRNSSLTHGGSGSVALRRLVAEIVKCGFYLRRLLQCVY